MPATKLKEFLNEHQVKYVTIAHSPAYTAHEIAASANILENELAKTVIVNTDGTMIMVVVPASRRVDLTRLQEITGANSVSLATEEEFKDIFPGCEVGAMPPFGNLYGMSVLVSHKLAEDEEIAFNAGTHTELVRLAYQDFARLVEPRIVEF